MEIKEILRGCCNRYAWLYGIEIVYKCGRRGNDMTACIKMSGGLCALCNSPTPVQDMPTVHVPSVSEVGTSIRQDGVPYVSCKEDEKEITKLINGAIDDLCWCV